MTKTLNLKNKMMEIFKRKKRSPEKIRKKELGIRIKSSIQVQLYFSDRILSRKQNRLNIWNWYIFNKKYVKVETSNQWDLFQLDQIKTQTFKIRRLRADYLKQKLKKL